MDKLILAVPKGRILKELSPVLERAGIVPEDAFFDDASRSLRFSTNMNDVDIIRVRSFDVATFVAFGAAAIGVAGSDVIDECNYADIYAPLGLDIGKCRLSVAVPVEEKDQIDFSKKGHIRVATKYPNLTKEFFAKQGVQAECIKLNGAMELAPTLGMCSQIVDLVSTGNTLKANGLEEVEVISHVSSYLIINRTMFKTCHARISQLMEGFKEAIHG